MPHQHNLPLHPSCHHLPHLQNQPLLHPLNFLLQRKRRIPTRPSRRRMNLEPLVAGAINCDLAFCCAMATIFRGKAGVEMQEEGVVVFDETRIAANEEDEEGWFGIVSATWRGE